MGCEELIIENIVNILLKHRIRRPDHYNNYNPKAYYYTEQEIKETLIKSPLILKRHFCENLENLLFDIINKDMYLDWTLSEVK